MEAEAISGITAGVNNARDWSRVYSDLTRHLKNKVENNQLDEVGRIFEMRDQLLLKLNDILKENKDLGADEELFMVFELIRTMEKECEQQLRIKMGSSRNQLSSLNRFKQSRTEAFEAKKEKVVSRFIDLKR